jgi:hypothetical protein
LGDCLLWVIFFKLLKWSKLLGSFSPRYRLPRYLPI